MPESLSVGPPSAISTKLTHAVDTKPVPVRVMLLELYPFSFSLGKYTKVREKILLRRFPKF